MILCDYGCGQEAIYQFKNGKWCCSKNYQSCPKSILIKENTNTNKICSYGCGQSAKFLIGKNEIPCCEISNVKCPEERRKNTNRQLGHIPWNKGLTKEDPRVDNNTKLANKKRNIRIENGELPIWNKGLTKEDPRVFQYVEKMKLLQIKGKPNYKRRKPISNALLQSFGRFIFQFKKILYTMWTFPILSRDNFKCTICNSSRKLEVHHLLKYQDIYTQTISELNLNILDWRNWSKEDISKIEEKIVEKHKIENGITLCKFCHSVVDKHRRNFLKKKEKELLIEHERKYFEYR